MSYECFLIYLLEITTHPEDRLVPVGSSVSLTCTSSVSSDVTFSWTRNGRDVTGQSTTTGDFSILTITSVRSSDDDSYVCTVRSGSLSVMSNTANLTVYGKHIRIMGKSNIYYSAYYCLSSFIIVGLENGIF